MARRKKKQETPDEAGIGHNSDLTDDQRRALLLNGIVKIEKLQEQMETLKADIRNCRKQMKADGFERFEVDYALRLRKADEVEELDKRRREARIAKWLNHPVGTQADMFDEPDRTPSVDKAYNEGQNAGMEGKSCEPPTHLGHEQRDMWIKGWHHGQGVLAEDGFQPLSDAEVDEDEAA